MKRFVGIILSIVIIVCCFTGCGLSAKTSDDANRKSAFHLSSKRLTNYTLNPTEEEVVAVLKTVDGVFDIECVTEDHDPNGKLHKAGGYTAAVYFQHKFVEPDVTNRKGDGIYEDCVKTDDTVDGGTDVGGCVEVYSTKTEAIQRNEYLSCFDGTFIDSGSHKVVGTIVIRTSNYMTATHQQQVTNDIIEAFKSVFGMTFENGEFVD